MKYGMLPVLGGTGGGVYQYSLALLEAMASARPRDERSVLVPWPKASDGAIWERYGWHAESLLPNTTGRAAKGMIRSILGADRTERAKRIVSAIGHRETSDYRQYVGLDRAAIREWLTSLRIDLLIFATPDPLSFEIGLPFVSAVHDLQHRLQPEFPEVSANGEAEWREYVFRNCIRQASMVLVDSDVGREDVLQFYGSSIGPDRIAVLPYIPPPYLRRPTVTEIERARARYDLPGSYLLFPAQFWPHKNHVRLVEAMSAVRRQGHTVHVVMTGSAGDEIRATVLDEIQKAAQRGGIEDSVHIIGQVPDADMASLYGGSRGVVLPTFFGPTNIPVLEAWKLDVPVLTSSIRGIREQAGDAAILVDPNSTPSIADGLLCLWSDETARRRLIDAGRRRVDEYGPAEFAGRLAGALDRLEGMSAPVRGG
jgi:glycosyltransferase involved in cell wall biosynthesis